MIPPFPPVPHGTKNPLPVTATVSTRRGLYQKNCAFCHGYDGTGKTAAGSGLNPTPADLSHAAIHQQSDGKLFYVIRHGIPDTAMPAWQLPDEATWQLVAFIRSLPLTATMDSSVIMTNMSARYVGSAACQKCHAEIYEHWKKTPMANVVRDPREHPEAILPDLSRPTSSSILPRTISRWFHGSICETALFQKGRRRLFSLSRAMGRDA